MNSEIHSKSIPISDEALSNIKKTGTIRELKEAIRRSFSIVQYESRDAVENDYEFIILNVTNIIQEIENIKKVTHEIAMVTADAKWLFPEKRVAMVPKTTGEIYKAAHEIWGEKPVNDPPV